MYISQKNDTKPIRIRQNPMHRSSSVSGIIHGTPMLGENQNINVNVNNKKSNHYVDALERFQRDYATIDKHQRQNKRYQKQQNYQRRRQIQIQRQNNIKRNQQDNLLKMKQRQYHSQMLHQIGGKKTAHTQSIAVNPINLQYQKNHRGKYQEYLDQQNNINKMIRAHNLQTQGTSGYNIINGKSSVHIQSMIPPQSQPQFQQKLANFYSRYRIGPGNQS